MSTFQVGIRKAIALLMAFVLTIGLCPIAPSAKAYANLTSASTQLVTQDTQYLIIIENDIENGSVSADKTEASAGETVTITATPDSGYATYKVYYRYAYDGYNQELDGNTFEMPDCDVCISAWFADPSITHEISLNGYDENRGTVAVDKEAATMGETVTVTANAYDDYKLSRLYVYSPDYEQYYEDITETKTFSMPPFDVYVAVELVDNIERDIHYVQNLEHGTIAVSPSSAKAKPGDEVTVTVAPDAGYMLATDVSYVYGGSDTDWTVGCFADDGTCTFSMPEDEVTVKVVFVSTALHNINYTLSSEAESYTVDPESAKAMYGTEISGYITPKDGYGVDVQQSRVKDTAGNTIESSWSSGGWFSFYMPDSAVTIEPVFFDNTVSHQINYTSSSAKGSVSINKASDEALPGEHVVITATPNGGYKLDEERSYAYCTYVDSNNDTQEYRLSLGWEDGTAEFDMPAHDVYVKVIFLGTKNHEIHCSPSSYEPGGMISANLEEASEGEWVDLYIYIQNARKNTIKSLTVNGEPLDLSEIYWWDEDEDAGSIQFQMPDEEAFVVAEFGKRNPLDPDTTEVTVSYDWPCIRVTGVTDYDPNTVIDFDDEPQEINQSAVLTLTVELEDGCKAGKFKVENATIISDENGTCSFKVGSEPITVIPTYGWVYNIRTKSGIEGGSVTAAKSEACEGETVTVTVTPDEGYETYKVYYYCDDDYITITGNSFVMPDDNVIVGAIFVDPTAVHNIYYGCDSDRGEMSVNSTEAVMGDTVKVSTTAKAGYRLAELYVQPYDDDDAIWFNDDITETKQFTMLPFDVRVWANFTDTVARDINYDSKPAHGIVTVSQSSARAGDKVTVSARPDAGYAVDRSRSYVYADDDPDWEIGWFEDDGTCTFTMPEAEATVNVVFVSTALHKINCTQSPEVDSYTVEINSEEVDSESAQAKCGTRVYGSISLKEGYGIDASKSRVYDANGKIVWSWWSGGWFEFTMPDSDVTIVPSFYDCNVAHKIHYNPNLEFGTVLVEPEDDELKPGFNGELIPNQTVELSVSPKSGYVLDEDNSYAYYTYIGDDGEEHERQLTYYEDWEDGKITFNMPARDVYIKVVFLSLVENDVTCSVTAGGTIYANRDKESEGRWVTLTINPSPNKVVKKITVNDELLNLDDIEWEEDEGTIGFRMPASAAIVNAEFGEPTPIAAPADELQLTWTGKEQIAVADTVGYGVYGKTSATKVGSYTAYVYPKYGYVWPDGSSDTKTIKWSILPKVVTVPAAMKLVYKGTAQIGVATGTDYTLSGTATAINAGAYIAKAALKDPRNMTWADGTTADKAITWTIAKAQATAPAAVFGLKYNGKTLTGTKGGTNCTVTGNTGKKAGNYTATAKAAANYQFANGSDTMTITWSIAKAKDSISSKITFNAKVKDVKKKAKQIALPKSKGNAKVTWTVKTKAKKNILTLKSGKIQIAKKTKKGSYKIVLLATVKDSANYKGFKKQTVTVTVKVK